MREDNRVIQGFWLGPRLSTMERTALNSFLRHGHEFHLYAYDRVEGVPPGVVMKDAAEVLPLSSLHHKDFSKPAIFSDFFRYKLLLDRGGWWVDTDTVCLRPFDMAQDYVFSSEVKATSVKGTMKFVGTQVNNGIIKVPAGSSAMGYCWKKCREMDVAKIPWAASGPALVESAVDALGLRQHVLPPQAFCPVMAWEVRKLVMAGATFDLTDESYAVHLWNEMWGRTGMDKDGVFPPGSPYEQLRQRYLDREGRNVMQSLWVGARLTTMERLSIASYLHHGDEFHLYTYGPCRDVPEGTAVMDANEVVPEADIEKFQNLTNFSDWFRYHLLLQKGGWWVDTDTVCVRPFDAKDEHVFVNQYPDSGHKDQINGDCMRAPAGSRVMAWLIEKCREKDWKRIKWSDIGPNLLTEAVRHFALPSLPSYFSFNPPAYAFVGPPVQVPTGSRAVHLVRNNWCGKWAGGRNLDRDASYPKDCLYEQFKRKYLPVPGTGVRIGAPWLQGGPRTAPGRPPVPTLPRPIAGPPWPQGRPDPNWRKNLLGAKVNHAVAREFRVAAICPMGSSYHMELRRIMPDYVEEKVETPEGTKVLFLVR